MQNNELPKEADDAPIYTLLQQIKDGTQNPETLTKDLRQSVVEILLTEGYSLMSMAQILRRSEKTIKRDLEEIRKRNALTPSIDLATKLTGELVMYAKIHRDHLMKLARAKDASVSEKSLSEYYAFKVEIELMTKLQTLGYLPTQPQAVVSNVFHHQGVDISTLDDLSHQIIELEKASDGEVETNMKEDLNKMKTVLEKIRASEENKT